MRRAPRLVGLPAAVLVTAVLAACTGSDASVERPATTTEPPIPALRILVTNDDGVGATGIDALVEALRVEPAVELAIVAPATDQSGTGGTRSAAPPLVRDAVTRSGRPAKAVVGYPADTVVWAVDARGLPWRPDLVVSGSNIGQNPSPYNLVSGTVGAARTAGARGIPAVAVSQGQSTTVAPDFVQGIAAFVSWFRAHRRELAARPPVGSPATVWSFNAPSCATGTIRGVVETPSVRVPELGDYATMDCTSTRTVFADDLEAWNHGFAAVTVVPVEMVRLAA